MVYMTGFNNWTNLSFSLGSSLNSLIHVNNNHIILQLDAALEKSLSSNLKVAMDSIQV